MGLTFGGAATAPRCWTCASNSGERRISPAPPVHEGTYWIVEHAYPVGLLGWMVVVLKRHLSALHELSDAEFHELARIQPALIAVLSETLRSEKEYVACFAEAEHFQHVHFHVVAVTGDMPRMMRGARSFQYLQVTEEDAVAPEDVRVLCETLRAQLAARLG